MDLAYSDEQIALRDGAEKFLRERYTAADRRTPGAKWPDLADLGWLGLPVPVEHGGLGGDMVSVGLIAEALGRNLVVEPFLSHVVLAAGAVAKCATPEWRERLLPDMLAGTKRIAFAHEEPGRGLAAAEVLTEARPDTSRLRLTGRKIVVLDAGLADALLVTAHFGNRVTLFYIGDVIERFEAYPTVDGRTAATISFIDAKAHEIGTYRDMSADIDLVVDQAVAVSCADIVGAMNGALDATVAYAKIRVQFGQAIGANQVVKHRLVEMAVACEEARSIMLKALIRTSDGSEANVRANAVSAAKVKIARTARFVCEQAVQLHGAMGVTEELDIGAYLKRVIAFEATLGTTSAHKKRYGARDGQPLEARA